MKLFTVQDHCDLKEKKGVNQKKMLMNKTWLFINDQNFYLFFF